MREAGFSPATSSHPKQNLLRSAGAQVLIEEQLDAYARVGITPDYRAKKIKEWYEAQKIQTSHTEPDKTVPDYATQLEADKIVRVEMGLATPAPAVQINNFIPILGGTTSTTPTSDVHLDHSDQEDPQP